VPRDLVAWLEDQKKPKVARIVLRRRSDAGLEETLREVHIDGDNAAAPADTAGSLMSRARNSARLLPGRSIFNVCALGTSNETIDTFSFAVDGEQDTSGSRDQTIRMTDMLMRHTEASARLALGNTLAITNKYREMLEMVQADNAVLRDQVGALLKEIESMNAQRFEQDMTVRAHEKEEEATRYAREKFDLLVPVLMSKVAPQLAQAGSGILLEDQVEKILASLRPDQVTRIISALDMEQQVAFGELMQAYGARAMKRQEERKAKEGHARKSKESADAAA
jgi:hypothetical protein